MVALPCNFLVTRLFCPGFLKPSSMSNGVPGADSTNSTLQLRLSRSSCFLTLGRFMTAGTRCRPRPARKMFPNLCQ